MQRVDRLIDVVLVSSLQKGTESDVCFWTDLLRHNLVVFESFMLFDCSDKKSKRGNLKSQRPGGGE